MLMPPLRFAKYYKNKFGEEVRTLIKGYGIRFDIMVFGKVRFVRFWWIGRIWPNILNRSSVGS